MIIVSNYVLTEMGLTVSKFQDEIISRVNLAWIKDKETAKPLIQSIENPVFLDYPHGRTKPPRPNMTLDEAVELMKECSNVRYFAISNVEKYEDMHELRARLPDHVELVPKIETKRGVNNLQAIVEGAKTKTVMLDKEDLYNDVKQDIDLFESLIALARMKSIQSDVTLLELRGVVFS